MPDTTPVSSATTQLTSAATRPRFRADPEILRRAERSRIALFALGWIRRRQVRAELMMLDDRQRLDAGITEEALAEALRRPLSFYSGQREDGSAISRMTTGRILATLLGLFFAVFVLDPLPAAADEQSRKICAARDLSVFSRIEEAEFSTAIGPNRVSAVADFLSSARKACRAGAYTKALRLYDAAEAAMDVDA